ncbi:AAA family ATPase [Flavobacterium columnare]|uniref:AAA family ATPase n=1 Tax=Flavobacterium columnare TaxID=996 RepID=UPI004034B694
MINSININLEDDLTLIVGKNNTGKTSLFEVINIFTQQGYEFKFEDFSQKTYKIFERLNTFFAEYYQKDKNEVRKNKSELLISNAIPKIQLVLKIVYDKQNDSLIHLSDFITDLDENKNEASILLSYERKESLNLFKSFLERKDQTAELIPWLKNNLKTFYQLQCYSIDTETFIEIPLDINFKNKIAQIVTFESIKASRNLDDVGKDKNKTLEAGFSNYYKQTNKEDDKNVESLEAILNDFSSQLDLNYKIILDKILDKIKNFGIEPHITIPPIKLKSEFDSESILSKNMKYYYDNGEIPLPENYNGLGYSNLIFLVLKVVSFIEKFKKAKAEDKAEFLTILIEEPEAHLHPQMQQVFIKQIKELIKESKISIQLIISSHSSHIITEAGIDLEKGFDRIRYFSNYKEKIEVNDFNTFKIGTEEKNEKETFRFLKQYLNLHKCDIFFADKVIMVEGVTEKMLLPIMINKVAPTLNNEYISVLEVGGNYTHKFKEILHFIKVKTLIITDIDSVLPSNIKKENLKECKVDTVNAITCNSTLKGWIPRLVNISDLNNCLEEYKFDGNLIRVTYQIRESDDDNYIARSLEESIINKNLIFFKSDYLENGKKIKIKNHFKLLKSKKVLNAPWDLRPKNSSAKTNFTFDLMTFDEEATNSVWEVPLYIKEGLEWLAKNDNI